MCLKDCPVCGNKPTKSSHNWEDRCRYSCTFCWQVSGIWGTEKEAIESWNKRSKQKTRDVFFLLMLLNEKDVLKNTEKVFKIYFPVPMPFECCPICGCNPVRVKYSNDDHLLICYKCKQFKGVRSGSFIEAIRTWNKRFKNQVIDRPILKLTGEDPYKEAT